MNSIIVFLSFAAIAFAGDGHGEGESSNPPAGSMEDSDEELKEQFRMIDKDNNGQISLDEYAAFLKSDDISATDESIRKEFRLCDENGDGYIDFAEFKALMNNHHLPTLECLQTAFQRFDKNRDGEITTDEFTAFLVEQGYSNEERRKAQIDEVLKKFDKDGNKKIDFIEFLQMVYPEDKLQKLWSTLFEKHAAGKNVLTKTQVEQLVKDDLMTSGKRNKQLVMHIFNGAKVIGHNDFVQNIHHEITGVDGPHGYNFMQTVAILLAQVCHRI